MERETVSISRKGKLEVKTKESIRFLSSLQSDLHWWFSALSLFVRALFQGGNNCCSSVKAVYRVLSSSSPSPPPPITDTHVL